MKLRNFYKKQCPYSNEMGISTLKRSVATSSGTSLCTKAAMPKPQIISTAAFVSVRKTATASSKVKRSTAYGALCAQPTALRHCGIWSSIRHWPIQSFPNRQPGNSAISRQNTNWQKRSTASPYSKMKSSTEKTC